MSSQLIISVGREFGSGGHEIAEKLAKHYGIPLLDHNLLEEIAQKKDLNHGELASLDEKKRKLLWSRTVKGFNNSPEANVSKLQFDYLREKAAAGESFVIVGRCSESVLKEYDAMVSIFILGESEHKIERVMERHNLSRNAAQKLMQEKDYKRKRYHNSYCEGKWGDSRNYDISVNSSRLGVDKTVEVLVDFIDKGR